VNHIARWDPQSGSWVPFASGIGGPAYSLLEYSGNLYTGGRFERAGLSNYRHLSRWTGTSWRGVGNQAGGGKRNIVIRNLAAHEGRLFTRQGPLSGLGTPPAGAEQYNAHSLHGRPLEAHAYHPRSLSVLDGVLYQHGTHRWENEGWQALPTPPNHGGAQEWFKGHLVQGGHRPGVYWYPKGNPEYWVTFLDGSEWMPMGYGLGEGDDRSIIHALKNFNNALVAGGSLSIQPHTA